MTQGNQSQPPNVRNLRIRAQTARNNAAALEAERAKVFEGLSHLQHLATLMHDYLCHGDHDPNLNSENLSPRCSWYREGWDGGARKYYLDLVERVRSLSAEISSGAYEEGEAAMEELLEICASYRAVQ